MAASLETARSFRTRTLLTVVQGISCESLDLVNNATYMAICASEDTSARH